MASPPGDLCGGPLRTAARTTILLAGLAAVAAGALLYIHLKQKYSCEETQKRKAGRSATRKGERPEKPQSRWKVVLADNQRGPFVHLKRPGQDPAEPHPYGPEIRALIDSPADLLLAAAIATPLEKLPGLNEVDYVWVERRDQLEELAAQLMKVSEFGVDTEQHSQHSFLGYTALLQISTRSCDYVVDTLALHDDMHLLRAPFSNPCITKVFHGSDNDIVWLQRDFHIYPVNLFDTYRAAIALEKPQKSLAFLLQCYCGVRIDKRFQKSDWRLRPLPKELLKYARTDAHYLVHIAECLRKELLGGKAEQSAVAALTEADMRTIRSTEEEEAEGPVLSDEEPLFQPLDGESEPAAHIRAEGEASPRLIDVPASTEPGYKPPTRSEAPKPSDKPQAISLELYAQVLRRSNLLCLQLYDKESSSSSSAASLIARHYSTPAGSQLARQQNPEEGLRFRELVRALCEWRDKTAREEDESLRAVLTDSALIGVALACPKNPSDLLDIVRESDRHSVLEKSKHAQHPFSEKRRSPSLVLERLVSAVCMIAARFTASHVKLPNPSEEEAGPSGLDSGTPETARGSHPGAGASYAKVVRGAREPSGWARVDDDSLSKKAHPAKQHRDPVAARARFVNKFACKKTVYENCRIYAGDGRLLCYCDRKKLEWYVQKGLAEFCGDDPPSITLRFEPKGRPEDENNEFYISSKSNRCVACGETSHYLRFRLVPSCYRQHFPEHLKSHRSHDIVLLCVDCHEVAHKATERHKKLVARKYGVPLIPARVQGNGTAEEASSGAEGVDPDGLRRAATALIMHGGVMPKERVAELQRIVKDYYGKEEITPQDLMEARLTGMGPKGQRRVYKKKGSRADGQFSSTRDRSETEGDSSGDDGVFGRADGNQRTSESAHAGRKEGGGIQEGEESSVANSIGEDAGGPRGGEGLDPSEQGEYSHRSVGSSSHDADSRSRERGEESVDSGDGAAEGVREGKPRLPCSSVESGRGEENGRDENGTTENGPKGRHGEAADRAHSHSRRNGILSRRQRQKLRALQAENTVSAMGGEEKGKRAEAVLGHGQHGRRVVEILEQTGGEDALREFVQEWRACFVEALRPNFLPPAWDVKHSGKREFGEFSVYKPKAGEDGEEQRIERTL